MVDIEARRRGIGGSDIGAILNESRYKTALEVYLSKTGQMPDKEASDAMKWGNRLEQVIADAFAEETGFPVYPEPGILVGDQPWHLANIDRFYDTGQGRGVLECKTANAFTVKDWADEPYIEYICQLQWYLFVTGCSFGAIAVLIGGSDFRIYYIDRDDELIGLLKDAADHFWLDHVMKQIPPENSTGSTELMNLLYSKSNGTEITLEDDHIGYALREYLTLKSAIKDYETELDADKAIIQAAMASASRGVWTDGDKAITVSWSDVSKTSFDAKTFAAENPDLFKKYQKASTYRVLRVTEKEITKKIAAKAA